jgi:hypothetical protein
MKRILIDGKPSRVVPVEPSEAMKRVGGDTLVSHLRSRDGEYIDENSAGAVCSAMLAASDPALTEAVVEMREALAQMVRDWASDDPTAEGQDVVNRARAALARITVETSDAG